jgi:hypothetical protein
MPPMLPRSFFRGDRGGGHLVSDQHAPMWWVLGDAEGNEACVATTTGRD